MKEENLERILLTEDRDVNYGTHYSFYKVFDRYGIKYVDQVLNDELMSNILLHCREDKIRIQLMSFVSLIKFKYLGIPMAGDVLLNETIINDENGVKKFDSIFSRLGFHDRQVEDIFDVVMSNSGKPLIDIFVECVNNDYFRDFKNRKNRRPSREFATIHNIMKMYVDSYAKTNNLSISTRNKVSSLKTIKDSIDRLMETERSLRRDIKYMKEKIMALEDTRDKVNREIHSLRDFLGDEEKKGGGKK